MSQTSIAQFVPLDELSTRTRLAVLLGKAIFGGLIFLLVIAAIPYGTVEPWWKAFFICVSFLLAVAAIVDALLCGPRPIAGRSLLLPMFALAVLAWLQTIPLPISSGVSGSSALTWNAISADPYQTRFVAVQLMSLAILFGLLSRYARSDKRMQILIYVVLAVAVASAIYGILRQTMQHQPGFILPLTKPNQGYGQFINKNHFAFLMEMAFGLGVGILVSGIKRERVLIYVAFLLPIWTALVLSNSRGGILAMLAQVICGALLLVSTSASTREGEGPSRLLRAARSTAGRLSIVVVLFVALLTGVLWVGGDRLIGSLDTVGTELNPQGTGLNEGATRNDIWRATWKMFKAHPIFGVGLGGYWIAITAYHEASGTLTPQEAHNDYLELLSSGGLVGLAIGVWFFLTLWQTSSRKLRGSTGFQRSVCLAAILGIVGIAVHSLVDFGLHMLANAFVFMVLLMMATTKTDGEVRLVRSENQ